MASELVVRVIGDATSLNKALAQSSKNTKKFERDVNSASRGAIAGSGAFKSLGRSVAFASGGFLTGVGITAAVKSSVSAASDLEQQVSKTDVVFGQSAKEVEDWSSTLVNSFGLSRREALATASGFGALFAPMGLIGEKSAEQSKKLTELGADLASFYNTDVASALDAVRSGIVGESEPLRRYGVQLSEVRVQQEALRQTGKTHVADLTVQEKTLARIAIIWEDTAKAQGDFGRTAETAANQAKIFAANMENLKAAFGGSLLPTLTRLVTFLNKLGPALNHAAKLWRIFFFSLVSLALKAFTLIVEPFSHLPGRLGGWARKAKEAVQGELELMNQFIAEQNRKLGNLPVAGQTGADVPRRRHPIISGDTADAVSRTDPGLTKKQIEARRARIRAAQEAFRQLQRDRASFAVDQADATKGLQDDLEALRRYNALLSKQMSTGHKTLALEREQFQVQQQIADVLRQQAEARKEQEQARIEARSTRQFRRLGLGPGGEELVPGVSSLKRQLASVTDAIEGSFLDTRKTRQRLRSIRAVLAAGINNVAKDVRQTIKQMIDDLNAKLKQASVDVTRFNKTASGQFVLAGAHGAGSHDIVVQGGIHLHGIQNVQQLENELAKRKKQRGRQRRSTR